LIWSNKGRSVVCSRGLVEGIVMVEYFQASRK
jgi:cell shape-determining protein MreC